MQLTLSIPTPKCIVRIKGASEEHLTSIRSFLKSLDYSRSASALTAQIACELDAISGDGHDFDYSVVNK